MIAKLDFVSDENLKDFVSIQFNIHGKPHVIDLDEINALRLEVALKRIRENGGVAS